MKLLFHITLNNNYETSNLNCKKSRRLKPLRLKLRNPNYNQQVSSLY